MNAPLYFPKGGSAPEGPGEGPEHERRRTRHLHLVPRSDGSRRPDGRLTTLVVAIVSVLAILATGVAVYAWQHDQLVSQQRASSQSATVVQKQLTKAQARITALSGKIAVTQKALSAAQGYASALHQRLTDLRDQLSSATAATAAAQAQLATVAGPPIADGRYLAFIHAVGATQHPPLLVVDVAQWFEGGAADRAAQKDGVIPTGQSVPNDYYIRNASPVWRTLPVGAQPRVSMITWHHGALGWSRVSLGRLQTAFTAPSPRYAGLAQCPFWIRIDGGQVTGIHQQYTP
jgi:hypothetical protein